MITSHKHIKITDIDAAYQSNSCNRYIPPRVMNNVDTSIMRQQEMNAASVLCGRKRGYSSRTAEIIASI